jgi:hypothetical protein
MREPRIHFHSRLFRLPGYRRYSATVLGRHIFVKGGELPPKLLRHELAHIGQIRRHGILGFYSRYLFEYFRLLWKYRSHHKAYWENPFEVEARAAEEDLTPPAGVLS